MRVRGGGRRGGATRFSFLFILVTLISLETSEEESIVSPTSLITTEGGATKPALAVSELAGGFVSSPGVCPINAGGRMIGLNGEEFPVAVLNILSSKGF